MSRGKETPDLKIRIEYYDDMEARKNFLDFILKYLTENSSLEDKNDDEHSSRHST